MSQSDPSQHEIDIYCAEWVLNGGDQSKAWRATYPKSKAKDKSVWEMAARMHADLKVLSRLKEMQEDQSLKDAKEFDVSASELKKILFETIAEGREKDPATGKPFALSVVTPAVSELNRMNGYHAATKSEITGKNGGAIETADLSERELARRIAFAMAKGARSIHNSNETESD